MSTSSNYGATPFEWAWFAASHCCDALPVVSNPHATISPNSDVKKPGKVPSEYNSHRQVRGIAKWTQRQTTPEEIDVWTAEPDYGICLQTRCVRAVDIDIDDAELAAEVAAVVERHVPDAAQRFRTDSARLLYAFVLPGESYHKRDICTRAGKIEFLAHGQQFIAAGTHPNGARYQWRGDLPTFPTIDAATFDAMWRDLQRFAITPSTGTAAGAPSDLMTQIRGVKYAASDVWFEPLSPEQKLAEVRAVVSTWTVEDATNRGKWFASIRTIADAVDRGLDRDAGLDIAEEFSQRSTAGDVDDRDEISRKMNESGKKSSFYAAATTARSKGYLPPHERVVDSGANVPNVATRDAYTPNNPMRNARLFVQTEYAHREHPLLVHQGGEFYAWDGIRWPELEADELRSQLYRFFEHRRYADEKGQPVLFQPNRKKVGDLTQAIEAVTSLPQRATAPTWLTANPLPADELISCKSGLIHWPTRTLHSHTPTFYTHHSVPFEFDPAAPRPERWLAFLHQLWPEDRESIECLQEWFGYLISGDTSLQKMLLIIGPRRCGKGTIARVLTAMLGAHNVAGPTLASLGSGFGLMPLIGKPAAIISDARLGSDSSMGNVIAERLLSISGEDTITVDRKHRDHWTGKLPTRIVVISNELPPFIDASGALPSRFTMLMLSQSFYGRENPQLTTELVSELPGIFNWALDGLVRLRERGRFTQPRASTDAVSELEDLASPVGAFVRERCELGAERAVACDALYGAYRAWCGALGHPPTNDGNFGRALKAVSAEIRKSRLRRPDRSRCHVYAGIGLSAS